MDSTHLKNIRQIGNLPQIEVKIKNIWKHHLDIKLQNGTISKGKWLVDSTHLKNIRQIGNLPQIEVKIKNIWKHHLDIKLQNEPFQKENGWWIQPISRIFVKLEIFPK